MKTLQSLRCLALVAFAAFPVIHAQAANVTLNEAAEVAKRFALTNMQLTTCSIESHFPRVTGGVVTSYIFNLAPEGVIFVAADNAADPIIFFSPEGRYDGELPDPLADLFSEANLHVADIKAAKRTPPSDVQQEWRKLSAAKGPVSDIPSVVAPMLTTTWNQSCGYNDLCPADAAAPFGYCGRTPTGCVATAMTQVMRFHSWPATGNGSHSYTSPYGTLSANFGASTYNWAAMPDNIEDSGESAEIARVMFHAGVALEMDYGADGSGAFTGAIVSSLRQRFRYTAGVFQERASMPEDKWYGLIRSNLSLRMPIVYASNAPQPDGVAADVNRKGNHAWVIDGYQAPSFYHCNWGWGGQLNGYFNMPGGLGDVGQSNYNGIHSACFNISATRAVSLVDRGASGSGSGSIENPYRSLSAAVQNAAVGSNLIVRGDQGSYNEPMVISKPLTITSWMAPVVIGR